MNNKELTIEAILKAKKLIEKTNPDMLPTHLIQQSKEHWKKHYPEWFIDDES